ncbi:MULTISPECIES: phosphate signaling complex protein PhoU [Stappia]|jgi:phosphate transport system protein|uniref:Phosphate-specific transport system accessory protein PhoU n=1 Tax=Stappia indica TaxID=538381 RepID=A0A857CC17_9HYPH|nr:MULTISPECIES: phosphate signaling complex protein PhoU [Stappia]QGZ36381.1 phosphate signaling complex protein PhoU [Stappia indica]
MSQHTVSSFDEELKDIAGRVSEMGGLAEMMLNDSVQALVRMDKELARRVIAQDKRVDALQFEIEEQAILIIARRQPVASDLRDVISAMRISNDLERVGDLAKNVAKRVIAIEGTFDSKKFALGVEHMTELAQSQLKDVLDAYAGRDGTAAAAVRDRDDEVDALYTSIFRELLTYMMEDPRQISVCAHLLFCAKNIERIGDHATNIAENVMYMSTGVLPTDERQKVDETGIETDTAS